MSKKDEGTDKNRAVGWFGFYYRRVASSPARPPERELHNRARRSSQIRNTERMLECSFRKILHQRSYTRVVGSTFYFLLQSPISQSFLFRNKHAPEISIRSIRILFFFRISRYKGATCFTRHRIGHLCKRLREEFKLTTVSSASPFQMQNATRFTDLVLITNADTKCKFTRQGG